MTTSGSGAAAAAPAKRGPGRPPNLEPSAAFLARRDQIVETAIAVFSERGFDQGTLDDVAQSLGTSRASLYHYVPSKAHLLYLIFDRAISTTLERMAELSMTEDPISRLEGLIAQQVRVIAENQPMFLVFFGDRPALEERYEEAIRAKERKLLRYLIEAVAEVQNVGELAPGDPRLVAQAILGMTSWFHKWFEPGRDDPDEYARICRDLVLGSG